MDMTAIIVEMTRAVLEAIYAQQQKQDAVNDPNLIAHPGNDMNISFDSDLTDCKNEWVKYQCI